MESRARRERFLRSPFSSRILLYESCDPSHNGGTDETLKTTSSALTFVAAAELVRIPAPVHKEPLIDMLGIVGAEAHAPASLLHNPSTLTATNAIANQRRSTVREALLPQCYPDGIRQTGARNNQLIY